MLLNTVIGIVAEYNPFHNGHGYQISQARKILGDVPVVAVMSSSFTQRGEAAIFNKWTRAQLAVAGGVDLVLELPVIYACRSSEKFAQGAIGTLAATGLVSHLVFGTETENPEILSELACATINKNLLKKYLKSGLAYGAAIEKTLLEKSSAGNCTPSDSSGEIANLLRGPNNILALEYYRALNKLHSSIVPLSIPRQGSCYKETALSTALPSAAALRKELINKGFTLQVKKAMPETSANLLAESIQQQRIGINKNNAVLLLNYVLSTYTPDKIKNFCDCSEGLENKMTRETRAKTLEEIVANIKSKRYPATRIQRLLCQLLISTDQAPFTATATLAPSYIRVLAFNDRGRKLLAHMKSTASLPIITKLKKNILTEQAGTPFALTLQTEIAATNLYDLLTGNGCFNQDFLQHLEPSSQEHHGRIVRTTMPQKG